MDFVPLELIPTAVARALSWLLLQVLSQESVEAIHVVLLECNDCLCCSMRDIIQELTK